jgi:hypothetical protein
MMSGAWLTGTLPLPLAVLGSDWLTATLVLAAIVLALLAVTLMFRRVDVSETNGSGSADTRRSYPAVYYDPVLIISAIGIVALAIAVWLLR